MPADFQLSVALSDPMVPLESAESCSRTSLRVTSAVIPLALLDPVPGGGDRDVGVVAGDVLPQEGRVHSERDGGAVLDDALGDLRQDAVGAITGVQLATGQSARQQRDDDDDDQDYDVRLRRRRGARCSWRRTTAAVEVVAVCAESVRSARHPQVTEAAGSSGSVQPRRAGAAAGVCRSAAPVVGAAAAASPRWAGRWRTPAAPIRRPGASRRGHVRDSAS